MVHVTTDRRSLLRGVGVLGAGTLAGCVGDSGGGGTETELNIVYPPWTGMPAFKYITEETDILENELNDRGYTTGEIVESWDDTTMFMAGQVDFMPTAGDAESAAMALERDLDLTIHAQAAAIYEGFYVREGSDLDPANTGSAKATFEKVIDEQRPFGFGGWNQGGVWSSSATFYNMLDMKYGPDQDPPLNLRQADWFTLPNLLVDREEVDIIENAPPLGMHTILARDDPGVVPVMWKQNGMVDAGLSPRTLGLGGFTTRTEFSEDHEEAIVGWMAAWEQAVEWATDPDNWEGILSDEQNWDYFSAESREAAEINLRFAYNQDDPEYTDNPLPVLLTDITLDQGRIDDSYEAIRYMEETGALLSDEWEDRLSFKALSL